MCRYFILAISVLTLASPARAQSPPRPLTLEEVLQLAEARSESIGIARTAITRADADDMRARSGRYPQLSASATYERALASEFAGVFDNVTFGGADSGSTSGSGTSGDGGLDDLPFGRENTWRLSLSFSQNLLDGGRIAAQRALAAVGRVTADIGVTTARGQLLYDVTQAYYDAALADRLLTIAQATVTQATATLQQTEVGWRAGTQPEFEVLRARVSRDTQNTTVIRARVTRDVALLRLKQLLDLPASADLQLADTLDDDRLQPAPTFATRLASVEERPVAAATRAAVQEVATTLRLREAAMQAVRAERLPTLSATSNYGRIAYPTNFLPTFDRANWTVGVTMQVPILTGGRQRADELSAAADLEQARLRLRQVEKLAELDTQSALAELLAARAAWDATAGTVQQAGRAYELADIRYGAGVSTQLELSDSRLQLQQAEANRAQAARDLQIARARVALLPELPLGAGGNGGGTPAAPTAPSSPTAPAAPSASGGQVRNASAPGAQFGGLQ